MISPARRQLAGEGFAMFDATVRQGENSAAPTSQHLGSEKPMDEAIEWQLLAHDEIFLHRKNRSQ
jgi:hypothetical protein